MIPLALALIVSQNYFRMNANVFRYEHVAGSLEVDRF
jgi:hypothetical protein